jgi:hypothetical protein
VVAERMVSIADQIAYLRRQLAEREDELRQMIRIAREMMLCPPPPLEPPPTGTGSAFHDAVNEERL